MEYQKTASIVWDFPVGIPETRFRKWAKIAGGKIILILKPELAKYFYDGHYPKNRLERAALANLVYRLKKKNDLDRLAKLHQNIWANADGIGSYESATELLMEVDPYLTEALESLLTQARFESIVEIGCGTGKFLDYLSCKVPSIDNFMGVDISPIQIEQNKQRFAKHPKLEFYAEDALSWLENKTVPNSIFITYGGVLEYFNENQVNALLRQIAEIRPAGLVVFEPYAEGFDPLKEKRSIVSGYEFNFSHPYPYMAEMAGMTIRYKKTFYTDDAWWIIMAAIKE